MSALTIQLPGLPPVTHVLKDDTITIGRMKGNTIVIEDASISLCHAKISRVNGGFYLKDLNSTNGTIVNGQIIREARLSNLDRVRFAEITAEFHLETPAEPAPVPQPFVPAPPAAPPLQPARLAAAAPPPAVEPAIAPAMTAKPQRFSLAPALGGALAAAVIVFLGWKVKPTADDNAPGALPSQPVLAKSAHVSAPPQPRISRPATADSRNVTVAGWIAALKSEDVMLRREAVRALNSAGPEAKAALPHLHAALKDPDAEVRIWSALALIDKKSYDRAMIPILVQALQQDDALVRQVSCLSLAVFPYEERDKETIVPALAETAGRDANADVRKAAVSALRIVAPELVSRETAR